MQWKVQEAMSTWFEKQAEKDKWQDMSLEEIVESRKKLKRPYEEETVKDEFAEQGQAALACLKDTWDK